MKKLLWSIGAMVLMALSTFCEIKKSEADLKDEIDQLKSDIYEMKESK